MQTPPPRRSGAPPRPPSLRPSSRPPGLDYGLAAPAVRVVEGALGLVPGERVVLVCDRASADLGDALEEAARWRGAVVTRIEMESAGDRPLRSLPAELAGALAGAQASVLLCTNDSREIETRREIVRTAGRLGLRHAHMVGITRATMIAGLGADPRRIADVSRALRARLRPGSVLRAASPGGTDLEVRCEPRHRWIERTGAIRGGDWANLPEGSLFTTPADAGGTFVADASMSPLPEAPPREVRQAPLRVEIARGRFVRASSHNAGLARDTEAFVRSRPNLDRVGLVTLGTNVGLLEPTGSVLVDEKMPGLHLTFGMTYPELIGTEWTATAQLVLTAAACDVDIDGVPVMRHGRYLVA